MPPTARRAEAVRVLRWLCQPEWCPLRIALRSRERRNRTDLL